MEKHLLRGGMGCGLSGLGAIISLSQVQEIIAIISTCCGFIISVLIPVIVKIINIFKNKKKGE